MEQAIGALLLAATDLARVTRVDPELTLRRAADGLKDGGVGEGSAVGVACRGGWTVGVACRGTRRPAGVGLGWEGKDSGRSPTVHPPAEGRSQDRDATDGSCCSGSQRPTSI